MVWNYVYNVWEDEDLQEPVIEEQFNPDRTILTLPLDKRTVRKSAEKSAEKNAAKKSAEKKVLKKNVEKKVTKKTQEKYTAILESMQLDRWYKAAEFESVVEVKESRIRVLLNDMKERGMIETIGSTKGKLYRKCRE